MKQKLEFFNQRDLNEYLRKETAKKVKHYVSDIEIEIDKLYDDSTKMENDTTITKVIGFRDCGVDHLGYIKCRFLDKDYYHPEKEYKEINEIRLEKKSDKVYYSVTRLFKNRYDTVERGLKANKYSE